MLSIKTYNIGFRLLILIKERQQLVFRLVLLVVHLVVVPHHHGIGEGQRQEQEAHHLLARGSMARE